MIRQSVIPKERSSDRSSDKTSVVFIKWPRNILACYSTCLNTLLTYRPDRFSSPTFTFTPLVGMSKWNVLDTYSAVKRSGVLIHAET